MATKHKDTPAKRAKSKRDPAIFQPPPRVKGDRFSAVRKLALVIRGRTYPIADNIDGQTPWSMGMDQTGTVTLPVRDPSGSLMEAFTDENLLQVEGVQCTINGVFYMVMGVDHDGEGLYTVTLEDEVSWRLKLFSSYKSASRARTTRYGFIQGFVDEASRKPYPKMRSFIPEVDDKQPIKRPKKTNS